MLLAPLLGGHGVHQALKAGPAEVVVLHGPVVPLLSLPAVRAPPEVDPDPHVLPARRAFHQRPAPARDIAWLVRVHSTRAS